MAENYEGEAIGYPSEVLLDVAETPHPNWVISLNGLRGNPRIVDEDGNDLETDDDAGTITVPTTGTGVTQIYKMSVAGVVTSYATIALAKAGLASTDTLFLGPGTFNERNVFSGTVNAVLNHALIQYTGTVSGIIDDSAAGSNADVNVTVSGFGSLKATANPSPDSRGVIHISRANSLVTFNLDKIEHTGTSIGSFPIWGILGEINGRAREINSSGSIALYWTGGNGNIYADEINCTWAGANQIGNAAVAGNVSGGATNSQWHVTCPLVRSTQTGVKFASNEATSRLWFTGQRVQGDECGVYAAGAASVLYVSAQKVEASTTSAAYAAIYIGEAPEDLVEVHITTQKVEGGNNNGEFGNIYMFSGRAWIQVLDELKDTGLGSTACVNMDGGEMDLTIAYLKRSTNFHAIDVRAGTLRLTDSYINTASQAGKSALRGVAGAVVVLRNVHLQVHAAANSIASIDGSTFTVICEGTCTSNRDPGANVTIIGTLLVDASFT